MIWLLICQCSSKNIDQCNVFYVAHGFCIDESEQKRNLKNG